MFQPFEGTPNYPELERSILKLWEEQGTFDKLRTQTANGEPWLFQDGPITANNPMGVHHAWGRTYKDIFQRFYAMNGRKLRWQNGFDCQGLWVEVEVEKALGFRGKPDILAFGMENFSRECRARVDKYAAIITEQSKRLGLWMDWERSYYTYDDSNIEHIWLFLKKCHEENWLAQDYRVMPWCPRCETSLSQHESADSYKEITHKSVYVKLPILDSSIPTHSPVQSGDNFLVWTTTPWTLTANVAVAVNPELTYIRAESDGEVFILSRETAKSALKPEHRVLEEISGADLVGLQYSGPFDDIALQIESNEKTPRRAVAWDEVGETEGTGIVHIAPGCGAEDFELGKRENLGFVVPVNHAARFVGGTGALEGLHALEDVETVLAELERRGRLYRVQRYKHSYPHCWRCSHELIFNAVQEWFIKADAGANPARERLRTAAKTVEWIPDYAGKRMDDWLQNMGDWCISRKRFWGLPLPFYIDHETGEVEVIGSRAELRERAVDPAMVDALPELHRPWIDEIQIRSRDGKRVLERVPEVGDAWLDAGIVPFATFGYNGATDLRMPELALNDETLIWDESKPSHIEEMTRSIRNTKFSTDIESRNFDVEIEQLLGDLRPFRQMNWQPVDFITEMREQVRLWFFSMLFMSVALEDRAPYKTAMVYETMLDQDGERISKTKKNGVPYDEAVETVGADPMRWTFCSNPLNKDIRFGYAPIHESARKLLTLWNVYGFFVNYANLDKPVLNSQFLVLNSDEQLKTQNSKLKTENILDRWILARLQNLIADVTSAIETVRPSDVTRNVESFVDDLSNWYVRRSRRRFWKSEGDEDKLAAYQTLHRVLVTVAQLVAPVIPFTAETMYQNLKTVSDNAPQSVHLCAWPQVEETLKNDDLVREVEGVLQCVSLGHKARKKSKIKVRQPLERLLIKMPTQEAQISAIRNWKDSILDELNVEHLEFVDSLDVKYKLRANLPKLGAKYGKKVSAIRHYLENASAEVAKEIGVKTRLGESVHITVNEENVELLPDEILITTEEQEGLAFVSEGDWAVALDMILTEPLIVKGLARDFIRAIQQARKDAGFEISDRIAILLVQPQDESRLPDVLEDFGDLIQTETLADELRFVDADYPELIDAKMGEETIRLRVEKMPGGELAF